MMVQEQVTSLFQKIYYGWILALVSYKEALLCSTSDWI